MVTEYGTEFRWRGVVGDIGEIRNCFSRIWNEVCHIGSLEDGRNGRGFNGSGIFSKIQELIKKLQLWLCRCKVNNIEWDCEDRVEDMNEASSTDNILHAFSLDLLLYKG